MEEILTFFNHIHPLSGPLREFLSQKLKYSCLSRKEFLLKGDQVARHLYFIKKGLLRSFYMVRGQEVCSKFMHEGNFIVPVLSFFRQKPGHECIQAIEDCELYSISYNDLQFMYRHFSESNIIGRMLVTKYYLLSEQRLYFMRKKKAAERYRIMQKHYPSLSRRIPGKYIASYLGISEETLSRIRCGKY